MQRTYPDEKDYEAHCREVGLLKDPDDDRLTLGGLYQSRTFGKVFAPLMMEALEQRGMKVPGIMLGHPKRWYGAPMAAVKRGFIAKGSPKMKLPENVLAQLYKLQGLYSRKLAKLGTTRILIDEESQGGFQSAFEEEQESSFSSKGYSVGFYVPASSVGGNQTQRSRGAEGLQKDVQDVNDDDSGIALRPMPTTSHKRHCTADRHFLSPHHHHRKRRYGMREYAHARVELGAE